MCLNFFSDSVTLDTEQTITGHKEFRKVTVDGTLTTLNLTADFIDDHDMEELHSQTVRYVYNEIIRCPNKN